MFGQKFDCAVIRAFDDSVHLFIDKFSRIVRISVVILHIATQKHGLRIGTISYEPELFAHAPFCHHALSHFGNALKVV